MICKECEKEVNILLAKGLCSKCYHKHKDNEARQDRLGQYVYIALCEDGGLYVGSTIDLDERANDHGTRKSKLPSKAVAVVYQNFPTLSKRERLQLENFLIQEIEPEHNTRKPTKETISDEIRVLGRGLLDRMVNLYYQRLSDIAS